MWFMLIVAFCLAFHIPLRARVVYLASVCWPTSHKFSGLWRTFVYRLFTMRFVDFVRAKEVEFFFSDFI